MNTHKYNEHNYKEQKILEFIFRVIDKGSQYVHCLALIIYKPYGIYTKVKGG